MTGQYADIILPLSVKGRYTYRIPENLLGRITRGVRVKIQFGKSSICSGIVTDIHDKAPESGKIKDISGIAGDLPIINEYQLRFWNWISEYYMCHEGEVLKAALPSEKAVEEYKPKTESYIRFSKEYTEKELNEILDKMKRASRQYEFLSELIRITGYEDGSPATLVKKSVLLKSTDSTAATLNALLKKGIIEEVTKPVSRLQSAGDKKLPPGELSGSQKNALESLKLKLSEKDIVLLHGVTSSGKTEMYIHLIEEQLNAGRQVLYMLPEIALTTQIIIRLKRHFGSCTGVYHSRFSDPEKVEIWKKVADDDASAGYRLILGVRSSVFLPFSNLGLVISR